jgi:hypothetical protein
VALAELCRPDHIAEDDRHRLSRLTKRRRRAGQLLPAGIAEAGAGGVLLAAMRATDHPTSLGLRRTIRWSRRFVLDDHGTTIRPLLVSLLVIAAGDDFLIAQAHAHGHTVVTHERPAPNAVKKIKIPDVCNGANVPYINTPTMLRREGARFALG